MINNYLIAAITEFGSPSYIYDIDELRLHARTLKRILLEAEIDLIYAVKANSNATILRTFNQEDVGFDACSVEEVLLLEKIGIESRKIHWNADAVSFAEMGILSESHANITIGSLDHLNLLIGTQIARESGISIRINTGYGAGHGPAVTTGGSLSKFGVTPSDLPHIRNICRNSHIPIIGLHAHAGSGMDNSSEYLENTRLLFEIANNWPGDLEKLNIGGGLSIDYLRQGKNINVEELATNIHMLSRPLRHRFHNLRIIMEPGRYLVAKSGVFVCTVTSVKAYGDRVYVAVDSGFNHFARPFLYNAYHHIDNLSASPDSEPINCDIVGNLCQAGDVLARNRLILEPRVGDLICIRDTGAYGYSMSSNYNFRPRPAEIGIAQGEMTLIRERETFEDLLRGQRLN